MDSLEPKKLALLRILQIFKDYSDYNHPLKQEDIANYLEKDYGIVIERKAISRNISLLKEAGIEIESSRQGSYLDERDFEDSELRMLIDGVLSNKYFRSHVKNIYSVNDWSKTDNQALFYNIELIDDAIEHGKQIKFDYNKYGIDKKLHRTTTHYASPYQLILHNQRYYLMSQNEHWHNMAYYRVDRITNMTILENPSTPINTLEGFESGINYKELASSLPYMYTDKLERVEFKADKCIIDQIVDWFGNEVEFKELDKNNVIVSLKASPLVKSFKAFLNSSSSKLAKPLVQYKKSSPIPSFISK